MKKFGILFAVALLASPLVALAQAGNPCTPGDTLPAGYYCDNGEVFANAAAPAPSSGASGNFVPLAPIPGLTDQQPVSNMTLFLNNLYKILIGFAAAIAVVEIIWGGLEYATQDNVSKKSDGKARITQAILGLILVLLPVLVFSIINPKILDLSVRWQPIALPGSTGGNGSGNNGQTSAPTTTTNAAGCTITGTLFKQASCPTQQGAQQFATSCGGSVLACSAQNANGSCADTSYNATCSTSQGPYEFIDISQAGFSYQGLLNTVTGYSKYEPVAHSSTNPNNGQNIIDFASKCNADGGTVCLSNNILSTTCTYTTPQPKSQSNTCYNKTMTCTSSSSSFYSTGTCGKNPSFTIVQ